jgi:hypothetical protein
LNSAIYIRLEETAKNTVNEKSAATITPSLYVHIKVVKQPIVFAGKQKPHEGYITKLIVKVKHLEAVFKNSAVALHI